MFESVIITTAATFKNALNELVKNSGGEYYFAGDTIFSMWMDRYNDEAIDYIFEEVMSQMPDWRECGSGYIHVPSYEAFMEYENECARESAELEALATYYWDHR